MQMEQLMTKRQAAYFCNIGERTLNRLMASGKVKFYRIGGQVRFDRNELLQMMDKYETNKEHDPIMG